MTITTGVRQECMLGAVAWLALPDVEQANGETRSKSFELNVIDGWVCVTSKTTDGGILNGPDRHRKASVREVLDAAPDHADWIARAHLGRVNALRAAGLPRDAGRFRASLTIALHRHGLRIA